MAVFLQGQQAETNIAVVQRSQTDSRSGTITWEHYGTCLAGTNFAKTWVHKLLVHSFKEQLWPGNMLQYQNPCNEIPTGHCMKLRRYIPNCSEASRILEMPGLWAVS